MTELQQPMAEMVVSATRLNTSELDWSAKKLSHPSRMYSKIAVINGVNSGTIGTSTQGAFSFQIPAKVLSLKDSYVSMDLAIATVGATATKASVIAGNLSNLFSRVVITADNNTVLADINDFHRYGSMLIAPSMKMETLNQECVSGTHYLLEDSPATSKRNPFNVLQKVGRGIFTDGAVQAPIAGKPPCDFFTSATTAFHPENTNENSYRHYIQQVAAANTSTNYSVQFRLKDLLPHTICALDQLLYFGGCQLQFDFYLNSIDFIGYLATNTTISTSPVDGQLPTLTFSNFEFNLCVENNVNAISNVVQKVKNEGLTLNIPYIYGSKTTISASTSHQVNQVITRSGGSSLLFVAYAPFTNSTTRDIINSHSLITSGAVTGQATYTINVKSYNTSLDNVFIKSQSTISVERGEHYLYNKLELKDSALQGLEALTNDFVHIDSYIGKSICDYDPSIEDGLAITENHTWGLTMTTENLAYQHYIYYCMQKKLVIGNFSVQVI